MSDFRQEIVYIRLLKECALLLLACVRYLPRVELERATKLCVAIDAACADRIDELSQQPVNNTNTRTNNGQP
jgi:hypothetical protein